MANKRARGLRAAPSSNVRFDLRTFEQHLSSFIGFSRENPGRPGGCDPVFTDGLDTVASSYLLSEMLSKYDDGSPNKAKEIETWKRFHEAEALCRSTNERLAVTGFKGPFEQVIVLAQKIAARMLGPFRLDAIATSFDWGPGATTRVRKIEADAAFKYSGIPETTYNNAALAEAAIRFFPQWEASVRQIAGATAERLTKDAVGNRVVTVPKNYKTDRTISVEPCMNIYVQKGIGAVIRRRLKSHGCDLDDQTRNQRLARVGAVAGSLATIDLSMASDTLSREFVSRFVRSDWLWALEQSRSQFGVLPSGEKIFYQKFSSMGNGYTFELQSLIFYSLALALCHSYGAETDRVSVYGDDIIIPTAVADQFLGLIEWCGFKPNHKKSHWTGPFRESCGKHYFLEHDVSPFYIKKPVRHPTDVFLLHNNLYRWVMRVCPARIEEARKGILRLLKRCVSANWRRARLPDGFGDGAFIGPFDEALPSRSNQGWEAWDVWVLISFSKEWDIDVSGLLPKAFARLARRQRDSLAYLAEDDDGAVIPTRITGYRVCKISVPWLLADWPFPVAN